MADAKTDFNYENIMAALNLLRAYKVDGTDPASGKDSRENKRALVRHVLSAVGKLRINEDLELLCHRLCALVQLAADPFVRASTISGPLLLAEPVFSALGDDFVFDVIRDRAVKDSSPEVRRVAVSALGRFAASDNGRSVKITETMARTVKDPDIKVRKQSLFVLEKQIRNGFSSNEISTILQDRILNDDCEDVHLRAAGCLEYLAEDQRVAAIDPAILQRTTGEVRFTVLRALETQYRKKGVEIHPDLLAGVIAGESKDHIRECAAIILADQFAKSAQKLPMMTLMPAMPFLEGLTEPSVQDLVAAVAETAPESVSQQTLHRALQKRAGQIL